MYKRQLVARVFLGAVFSGQMMTLFYSLGGGLLCWLVLLLLSRLLTWKQIWLCSPISAVFHNLGQLLVAAALLGSWTVLAYLPYLVVAGAASGLFTGLCAQLLAGRLKGLGRRSVSYTHLTSSSPGGGRGTCPTTSRTTPPPS